MEKPIIFSAPPMVRAIIEGRKTQTRRVIKNILPTVQRIEPNGPNSWAMFGNNNGWTIECPYGIPGSRLWVREKWRPSQVKGKVWYAEVCGDDLHPRWHSPIFMPRWASRITLEVVSVRVERAQEISRKDAIAEGMNRDAPLNDYGTGSIETDAYAKLWDFLNSKRGYPWASNPWVWCISFRRIDNVS